jgi:hypothetical protein
MMDTAKERELNIGTKKAPLDIVHYLKYTIFDCMHASNNLPIQKTDQNFVT